MEYASPQSMHLVDQIRIFVDVISFNYDYHSKLLFMVVCTYVQVALSTGAKKFSLGEISSLGTGEPILDSCQQQSGDGFAASGKIDEEHNHVLKALRITFALLFRFRPAL